MDHSTFQNAVQGAKDSVVEYGKYCGTGHKKREIQLKWGKWHIN